MTRQHATRRQCIDDSEYNRHVSGPPDMSNPLTPAEVAANARFWAQVAADLDRLAARTDARSRAVAALYRRVLNNRNRSRPAAGIQRDDRRRAGADCASASNGNVGAGSDADQKGAA